MGQKVPGVGVSGSQAEYPQEMGSSNTPVAHPSFHMVHFVKCHIIIRHDKLLHSDAN